MNSKSSVYLSLGSNLNDPINQLKTAIASLQKLKGIQLIKTSSFYLSSPIDNSKQNNFVNCVVLIKTDLSPLELLKECQKIEKNQGKIKLYNWGPRTIDIDLILYDKLEIKEPDLIIPHPEMLKRDFVIEPLLELCENVKLPTGKLIKHERQSSKINIIKKLTSL